MKTTRYFEEQVLRKRPYIQRKWCEKSTFGTGEKGGSVRRPCPVHQVFIPEIKKYLRVVTLKDELTIHNRFSGQGL